MGEGTPDGKKALPVYWQSGVFLLSLRLKIKF